MEWEKPLRKTIRSKNENSKIQSEIDACEQKKLAGKHQRKIFTPQNHSLFCSTS